MAGVSDRDDGGMESKPDQGAWPIPTHRLTIRRIREEDHRAVWEIRRQDGVARWMTSAPKTFDEHLARFAEPDRMAKTLVIELDGRLIGDLMVAFDDPWAQTEVAEQARGVQA